MDKPLRLQSKRETRRMSRFVCDVLDFTEIAEPRIRILLLLVSIEQQQLEVAALMLDNHQIAFA